MTGLSAYHAGHYGEYAYGGELDDGHSDLHYKLVHGREEIQQDCVVLLLELGGEDAQEHHEEDDGQDISVGHGGEDIGGHYACKLVDHVHVLGGNVPGVAGEHHVPARTRLDDADKTQSDDNGRQGGQQIVGECLAKDPPQVASRHAGHSDEYRGGYQRDDYHVQGVEEQVPDPFYVLCPMRQESYTAPSAMPVSICQCRAGPRRRPFPPVPLSAALIFWTSRGAGT